MNITSVVPSFDQISLFFFLISLLVILIVGNQMRRMSIGEVGVHPEHVLFMPMEPLRNLITLSFHTISFTTSGALQRKDIIIHSESDEEFVKIFSLNLESTVALFSYSYAELIVWVWDGLITLPRLLLLALVTLNWWIYATFTPLMEVKGGLIFQDLYFCLCFSRVFSR